MKLKVERSMKKEKLLKGWSRGGHSKEETWMKPPGPMFEAHEPRKCASRQVTSLSGNKHLGIQMRQSE